jgi:ion channel POLLUX/CASTOR
MAFTKKERLRYAFDNTLARGTIALIAWLAIISFAAIVLFALIIVVTGAKPTDGEEFTFGEAMWASLMRTLDAGTMGGDTGWGLRAIMFMVTLLGIFVLSTLIGVLSSGLEDRIDELRKGRSRVVEQDHTVVLGWSEQIFPILSELIEANKSRPKACIVVLGEKDKVEMEEEIRDRIEDTFTTRIICRSGDPTEPNDLHIASIDEARSLVVLAPDAAKDNNDDAENADISVVKTLLAVLNRKERKAGKYSIVAELRNPKNADVAALVGKDEVELVLVGDLVARIIAQTCRQSGLSVVYTELLDFDGDEIYFRNEPSLVGKQYGSTLLMFEDASVMGILPAHGVPLLNPPMDHVLAPGDKLIAVAEDDDAFERMPESAVQIMDAAIAPAQAPRPPAPERTVVLGWNWRAARLIGELDAYVAPGSVVVIVSSNEPDTVSASLVATPLKKAQIKIQQGDATSRANLDALNLHNCDHIIVLAEPERYGVKGADNRTLVTLLHLRDILQKAGRSTSIVSEMLDINNRRLAESARVDDFIVSDRLVSLMMSQVTENRRLNDVFRELFSPEGSEIYLKDADRYIVTGQRVSFATVVEAARRRGETAIGYRLLASAHNADEAYGVVVNPKKTGLVQFAAGDKVVVLAEDES